MKQIQTDWWVMDLPPEWQAEQDDEAIVVSDEDGVGCISVLTLQTEGSGVAMTDLEALIQAADLSLDDARPVQLAGLRGYYFELEEDGEFIREWYLAAEDFLLLISYSCDEDNRTMDREVVDQILDTLELLPEAD